MTIDALSSASTWTWTRITTSPHSLDASSLPLTYVDLDIALCVDFVQDDVLSPSPLSTRPRSHTHVPAPICHKAWMGRRMSAQELMDF